MYDFIDFVNTIISIYGANHAADQTSEKVSISAGNRKMGGVPSVSLPPVITCAANAPCVKKCYARKICRYSKQAKNAYERNLRILQTRPVSYWAQVYQAAATTRYFRYHVSGDIPNNEYMAAMVALAKALPTTEFLAFTKRYGIVNNYINAFGELPANLHILFSRWNAEWDVTIRNPYDLPMSAVIFKGDDINRYEKVCPGNCSKCACRGTGCWTLAKGEIIAFLEH